jgi:hypothetical protein
MWVRLTQHKRFVPCGTHLNFCFAKTSFMLGTLGAISAAKDIESKIKVGVKNSY